LSDLRPPPLPLRLLEGRVGLEASTLLAQLPLLRLFAPRGEGRTLVLPGFMSDDSATWLLRRFLDSLGYQVSGWRLGLNRGALLPLLETITQRVRDEGEPVHLVGWSRGGIIAREVARDCPELTRSVVTMGTPVRGGLGATSIRGAIERDTGVTPESARALMRSRRCRPITVPITAIYSRTDGVVAWRACIDEESPDVTHVEVVSSHTGMGFHAEVFREVAKALAAR
jgi:hypothetical protein